MSPALILPPELTIYSVAELLPKWRAWVDETRDAAGTVSPKDGCVDGSAVGEVDAAGVQLLLSLSKALAQERRTLHVVNPSRPLTRACEALGVSAALLNPEATGAAA
jgi:anti-anti-sigma regulatory factor